MNMHSRAPDAITVRVPREMTRHPGSFNPRLAPEKQYRFDGQGGWAKNSSTPPGGWLAVIPGVIAVLAVFAVVAFVGTAAGF